MILNKDARYVRMKTAMLNDPKLSLKAAAAKEGLQVGTPVYYWAKKDGLIVKDGNFYVRPESKTTLSAWDKNEQAWKEKAVPKLVAERDFWKKIAIDLIKSMDTSTHV